MLLDPLKGASYSDGEEFMNSDEAGRVNGALKSGKRAVCAHQRIVDAHYNAQGKKTGRLVCRECGEVIPDSVKA
jgi:hypothetical protein